MEIQRETLRELQYLQEDIAAYFTDEHVVSGETYWTCVESVAIAKLAELRGEPLYYEKLKEVMESLNDEGEEETPQNENWLFIPKKSEKKFGPKTSPKPFVINKTEEKI